MAFRRRSKVEFWPAPNGRWYFHRRSSNGKITDPSQGYSRKDSAVRGIRRRWPSDRIVECEARPR